MRLRFEGLPMRLSESRASYDAAIAPIAGRLPAAGARAFNFWQLGVDSPIF